ncbi:MAG TPA: VOC family protein, partial [Candidatus Methylomirabilis sp.]|nr:VOC family protein [Candidatus Methylomirabilis sp.]
MRQSPAKMARARRPITQQITFLDTPDMARTADFYERVLGLRLARDQGRCRVYHVSGDAYIGFCE